MVNLNFDTAYQYIRIEKDHLKRLRQKYGHLYQHGHGKGNKKVWYDGQVKTNAIKHEISKRLLIKSCFRCAYCGKFLVGTTKSIDHFIPNADYPVYSFHPLNLIPSCGYCNEIKKKQYDPILHLHQQYHRISFKIVHPIIHNVNKHFVYITPKSTVFNLAKCSAEAKESIRLFQLDSFEMSMARTQQQSLFLQFPITNLKLQKLVAETATYKPKKK